MNAGALTRPCPFCGATVDGAACPSCKRDPTAARRVCTSCQKMTPVAERACVHCQIVPTSELAWKVPVIIALFVGALILSVAVLAIAG
jgi:hypothetical protein